MATGLFQQVECIAEFPMGCQGDFGEGVDAGDLCNYITQSLRCLTTAKIKAGVFPDVTSGP